MEIVSRKIWNLNFFSPFFVEIQGRAIAQMIRTFDNITVFGVCSKGKHEELKESGLFDHLIDRTDYINEIRK